MVSLDKRYKSVLFEYCQKKKINRPSFSTLPAEGDVSGFQSEVTIEGTAFGPGGVFSKKKQAENDASRVCLISLGLLKKPEEEGKGEELVKLAPQQTESTSGVQETPTEAEQRSEAVVQEESDTKQALPVPAESANLVISSSPVAVPNQPSNGVSSTSAFGYNDQSPVHSVLTKRPKSILQEFCQKSKMSLPVYDTQASYQGNRISGYTCVLTLNDVTYPSDSIYPNKRDAEHSAAAKALASLDPINIMHSPYSIRSQGPLPSPPLSSPTFSTHSVSYKNLLQEHMQQRSLESPIYDTKTKDSGYSGTVNIEGKVVEGQEVCATKKLAEQSAAKAGLIELGVKDPEACALRLLRRRSRGQFRIPRVFPFKTRLPTGNRKETWIHTHPEISFDTDDYEEAESGYIDFQHSETPVKRGRETTDDEETSNKRQRVGDNSESKTPSYILRRRKEHDFEVADVHLGNLSVGEVWPERKNVVIVGSSETSIPLYCTGARGRCALEDKKTSTLVDILPGHRLVGLEGHYIERGGHIVLKARRCQEVVMPAEPDKVLVSCGVVVLHCIPRKREAGNSCDVNILLKRYLSSQAFVNVTRGLAQYFRRKTSQHPITLDKSSIVRHISEWMLEEVLAIASMTEQSVENVFRHTMRFNKRWGRILNPEDLPEDLKELQSLAQEELSRRSNVEENQDQDRYRPWRLPKGNFHHRILSTGVFIESPAECAMRELREETGIRLKLNDIASSPYVDLHQADNLNPHQGDVARYYLCGIITEDEDINEGSNEPKYTEENRENSTSAPTAASEAKTPDKSEAIEDPNIIRSPSVSGALHEECTWFDVDEAKNISKIFNEVYQSNEFQKLMATLKKIVSEM